MFGRWSAGRAFPQVDMYAPSAARECVGCRAKCSGPSVQLILSWRCPPASLPVHLLVSSAGSNPDPPSCWSLSSRDRQPPIPVSSGQETGRPAGEPDGSFSCWCPAVAPLRALPRPARLGDLLARHDQDNDHPDQPEPADADPQAKTAPVLSDERVSYPPCQPHDERYNRHNNPLPRYSAQARVGPSHCRGAATLGTMRLRPRNRSQQSCEVAALAIRGGAAAVSAG